MKAISVMRNKSACAGFIMTTMACMGVITCQGSGESIKKDWYAKISYNSLQLYTSSDLVGQARLDRIVHLPTDQCIDGFSTVFSVVFTNVMKGQGGAYLIYAHPGFQDPIGADLSAFSDFAAYTAWAKTLGEKGDWKWREGHSYILICSSNPVRQRWELHSVVLRDWAEYVQDLREKRQDWHYWTEELRAKEQVLSEKLEEARVAMKLGDIPPEAYKKEFEEYRAAIQILHAEHDKKYDYADYAPGVGRYWTIDWGLLKEEVKEAE
jgi:hypothetical protein